MCAINVACQGVNPLYDGPVVRTTEVVGGTAETAGPATSASTQSAPASGSVSNSGTAGRGDTSTGTTGQSASCINGCCEQVCGADCVLGCETPNCECAIDCIGVPECQASCLDSSYCKVDCTQSQRCATSCAASTCVVICDGVLETCVVHCLEGAECLLSCGAIADCDIATCAVGAMSCNGGLIVCNMPCP